MSILLNNRLLSNSLLTQLSNQTLTQQQKQSSTNSKQSTISSSTPTIKTTSAQQVSPPLVSNPVLASQLQLRSTFVTYNQNGQVKQQSSSGTNIDVSTNSQQINIPTKPINRAMEIYDVYNDLRKTNELKNVLNQNQALNKVNSVLDQVDKLDQQLGKVASIGGKALGPSVSAITGAIDSSKDIPSDYKNGGGTRVAAGITVNFAITAGTITAGA